MQGLIGKKIGMTRIFDKDSGEAIAVSVIHAASNVVYQVKTIEKDGYSAVQLGYGGVKEHRVTKPLLGHMKKHGGIASRVLKEFSLDNNVEAVSPGQRIGVEIFEGVKFVDVVGITKGRGFAGTIKRYGFHRGRETHGNTNHRERGSVGSNTRPARVIPGKRMAGHYGARQVTIKGLRLLGIDKEKGVLLVGGAIPGPSEGFVFVKKNHIKDGKVASE